jgi:SAM-dependent methyltransferase
MRDDARSSLFTSGSIAENYRRHLFPTVFAPWARRLVEVAALDPGQTVLDVASGTGAVARAAASAVGAGGRVIASDASAAMLAEVPVGADPGGAPIEILEAPATLIPLPDHSVDAVLCQHGLPFVRDQAAAVAEMRRIVRPGGVVGIVVWEAGRRLEPFDSYGDVLRAEGIDEPFPRAWDFDSFKMTEGVLTGLLGDFADVSVREESLRLDWPSVEDAVGGILGTPYGPVLASLPPDARERAEAALRERFTDAPHPQVTALVARCRG